MVYRVNNAIKGLLRAGLINCFYCQNKSRLVFGIYNELLLVSEMKNIITTGWMTCMK